MHTSIYLLALFSSAEPLCITCGDWPVHLLARTYHAQGDEASEANAPAGKDAKESKPDAKDAQKLMTEAGLTMFGFAGAVTLRIGMKGLGFRVFVFGSSARFAFRE